MDISYSMRNTFPALPIVLLPLMLCPYGSSTPLQEGLSNAGRKVFFPKKPFLETYTYEAEISLTRTDCSRRFNFQFRMKKPKRMQYFLMTHFISRLVDFIASAGWVTL